MPSAFISYRRRPSAMLATLIARELTARGITTYLDTRQTDGGGPFPERLLRAIESHDVFVCLIAEGTFESGWVRQEIAHAYALGTVMIPVFQESYVPLVEPPDEAIAALLQYDGVHIMDVRNIYVEQALDDLAAMIKQSVPRERRALPVIPAAVGAVIVVALAVAGLLLSGVLGGGDATGDTPAPTDDPGPEAAAVVELTDTPGAATEPAARIDPAEYGGAPGANADWTVEKVRYQDVPFVNVPSGCFEMGGTQGDEAPPHVVCLDEFWIGQYAVTVAQYAACVDAGACTPPADASMFSDLYTWGDYPVTHVSWDQAQDYAEWFGGSLLTEAQWEYAARGPESWRYPSGDTVPGCDDAMTVECTDDEIVPVDAAPGASWVGAQGMAGGVWEWVADWYGPYPDEDWIDNPTGAANGNRRVVRGGAFDATAEESTATIRVGLDPGTQSAHTGFRIGVNWNLRDTQNYD